MFRPGPLHRLALALSLLAAALGGWRPAAAQGPGPASGPFTQPDVVDTTWSNYQDIPDRFTLAAQNASFELYADTATAAFKVRDKRSGYVWHSNLDEVTPDDKLNKTWTAFATSGISLDYLDKKANTERLSITRDQPALSAGLVQDGFQVNIAYGDAGLSLDVVVRLEPTGVSVEVPFASIQQSNPDNKLGLLYVYPFFGATREAEVPGYMLIPDGAGSLIRFSADTKAKNMFYGRYYGADLGMQGVLPFEPTINRPGQLSVPVFGMVHGYHQNGFIAVVEKGAAYGEIQAHPAGVTTRFNFLYNAFVYNESYFQATNRSGAGVTTLQPATNAFDVKIHYRLLTGPDSDYVGMARSYQQYLVERGVLKPAAPAGSDIGIRLEFLGGDKERVLFWDRMIAMTSVSQMRDILADLGLRNEEVIYYGWQPLGASSTPPTSVKLDGSLGTVDALRALAETVAGGGGTLSLYVDPQAALKGQGGYSTRSDLALSITSVNLEAYNRNMVNYYFNLDALGRRYRSLSQGAAGLGLGLALDGLGANAYSDFRRNHLVNREFAIQQIQALLAESGAQVGFYRPNDYAFGAMRAYYDMPLSNSGYLYTTDLVPFLPIVLAGYVPSYGRALNFSSNAQDDLLRHADFGVYPSYFLTQEPTAKILNTRANWIYTSSYAQWSEPVKTTYRWLDALLGPVKGQPIVAREVLAPGVVATTYANRKQIVVNYTAQPYTAAGVTVAAQDALLREAAP